jgi:drug/metabolite transporter (DMT)-like permease
MRWVALTAVAPVAWANYYVTHEFLPPDSPLYGAALRALPAGLVLLGLCRQRPRGAWWWRSAVLGLLNVSVFFVLVYAASQLLPTSIASTAWQLTAGGLFLLPVAAAMEGPPPALSTPALLAFGYVTLIGPALAFAAWFTGLRHLPAGTVGLVGLLNPVTGVLLGTAVAGEVLTVQQVCGLALVLVGVVLGRPTRTGRRGGSRIPLQPAPDKRPADESSACNPL